ncbi:phosphotransferase [Lapillicoccus sp.]|uniref:phosphotransferase n=1 Tax=Lapillicoccus sp. TaxID=1909287 RepID=UPI0039837BEA
MDRVSVESPTGLEDVVLRRWRDEEWAEGLVAREAAALAAVRGHGVPAPRLLAMDEDGSETGVQCTLTSALTGHPDLSPTDMQSWLDQLATTQAAIHAVPNHPPARWHRWSERSRPLDWLADPRAAERRPTGGRGATSRGGGAGARRLPAL